MAMLAMGSSITGHHQFSNDFLRRCTRMVDLTILSFKDMDLVYGLLILCKLFFHHLELEKSAYYSNLAVRLRNVPKSTKLQIQMISEGLASMKDPHDREYLLKKALAHKPRGYELVLLYMHFLRNEVCRGVKPTDNLLNSSLVMQSYLDEADVTIDSCEMPLNPINVRWSLTLRLIVLGYRAAIHSRIQEKEEAIAEANKVTNVLSSPHLVDMNNLYLGDIFGLCFAAMIYLKYKEHDMLDKVIHILRINGSRLPLAEHAADCAERVKESGVEIDDRMGALVSLLFFPSHMLLMTHLLFY
jgi:hypothetical protein